ncbi:MAG TPA: nickel-binding protein [Casimicrobiaceae bacterium]|jgi:class 3 adenylate cyclase|nr:nickel-binding protein [Casimicrobiaceae bacterium]
MPMYMDIHEIQGVNPEDVAKAHLADVKIQDKYGVEYIKYWLNESRGKIFCLCNAPSAEAADRVHREAHGLPASKIIEVEPDVAQGFLGGTDVNPAGAAILPGGSASDRDPGIRTVLFTDIVDSTALTQRLGDEAAMTLLDVHDSIVRDALRTHGGREVKHTGDGIMACFLSSAGAVRCAARIQRALGERVPVETDVLVRVRIGAAAGEPVENHDDLFGATVQLAARLCTHADPQQSLVSNAVAELCLGKGLAFRDLGEVSLKGFEHPIHVHAVA